MGAKLDRRKRRWNAKTNSVSGKYVLRKKLGVEYLRVAWKLSIKKSNEKVENEVSKRKVVYHGFSFELSKVSSRKEIELNWCLTAAVCIAFLGHGYEACDFDT